MNGSGNPTYVALFQPETAVELRLNVSKVQIGGKLWTFYQL